ncbi:hypothetical protein GCM10017562_02630 [Streptomyces roseofulvus]
MSESDAGPGEWPVVVRVPVRPEGAHGAGYRIAAARRPPPAARCPLPATRRPRRWGRDGPKAHASPRPAPTPPPCSPRLDESTRAEEPERLGVPQGAAAKAGPVAGECLR